MTEERVKSRYLSATITVLVLTGLLIPALLLVPSVAGAKGVFKLKNGAEGKLCLECHEDFKKKLKEPHVHTPLAEGECIGCHNPHTSSNDQLMAAKPNDICYQCHDGMVPDGTVSAHKVVIDGQCTACHDPHASANRMNLIRAGSELCYGCHQELGSKISNSKFQHSPVKKDCLRCHNPHASTENKALLVKGVPELCKSCHRTDRKTFKNLHMNYPVGEADCTSCHDPHGSNMAAILYNNVHEPVAKRMCKQCHAAPDAAKPLKLKQAGYKSCQGCHYDMLTETLNQKRVHWPVVDKRGCLNCHTPHASAASGLLLEPQKTLCAECHADTVARQERSSTKHPPVDEGKCSTCHAPHGSDNQFIMNQASVMDICGTCHDWQGHSSHPIGDKVIDPRNQNITLQCLSCHRSHGTEHKHFLYYETTNEMCIQCHTGFRR